MAFIRNSSFRRSIDFTVTIPDSPKSIKTGLYYRHNNTTKKVEIIFVPKFLALCRIVCDLPSLDGQLKVWHVRFI